MSDYHLDTLWHDEEQAMEFVLTNLSDAPLSDFRLFYGTLTRTIEPSVCDNARLLRRQANYHEYAPHESFTLAPGQQWRFTERSLSREAVHSNEGPRSGGLLLADDTVLPVECADLQRPVPIDAMSREKAAAAILPWPASLDVCNWWQGTVFHLSVAGANTDELRVAAEVTALSRRLYPLMPTPFVIAPAKGTPEVTFKSVPELASDSYYIGFETGTITLRYGPKSGLLYGLITLAQMLQGAQKDGEFAFPRDGHISDTPRHPWRGSHFDVSRQFRPIDDVLRFVDILAWHKMNRFHWHLSDDEGWRLEIKAYPELTETAAHNGFDYPVLPQMGHDPKGQGGFYTQDQARMVVAHAARIGVEIMPEIDVPGHCACVLGALPDLVDPDEPESYWSVQRYANNALNPGIDETYVFVEKVLSEICDIFPFDVVHIGGDEVADNAWLRSPKAQVLMQYEGLSNTHALQSYFLGKVQDILTGLGRITGGWEEVALGGGIRPENALLFAWTEREKTAEIAKMGYNVVSTPGQAYYLDMAQSADWHEPGASWAGVTSPETSYAYEAQNGDPDLIEQLQGVHACIWCEYLTTNERMNHMVFPRLSAIAEAGWTPNALKDFNRFTQTARFMPRM